MALRTKKGLNPKKLTAVVCKVMPAIADYLRGGKDVAFRIVGRRPDVERPSLHTLFISADERDSYSQVIAFLSELVDIRNPQVHPFHDSQPTRVRANVKPRFPRLLMECTSWRHRLQKGQVLHVTVATTEKKEVDLVLTRSQLGLRTNEFYGLVADSLNGLGDYASHVVLGSVPVVSPYRIAEECVAANSKVRDGEGLFVAATVNSVTDKDIILPKYLLGQTPSRICAFLGAMLRPGEQVTDYVILGTVPA